MWSPAKAPKKQTQPTRTSKSKLVSSRFPRRSAPGPTRSICAANAFDEALDKVDAFLDRMLNIGEPLCFVLHGHGTGALKWPCARTCRLPATLNSRSRADADSAAMRSRSSGYGARFAPTRDVGSRILELIEALDGGDEDSERAFARHT